MHFHMKIVLFVKKSEHLLMSAAFFHKLINIQDASQNQSLPRFDCLSMTADSLP